MFEDNACLEEPRQEEESVIDLPLLIFGRDLQLPDHRRFRSGCSEPR